MSDRDFPGRGDYHEPELPEHNHRPAGKPRPREIKSQKAQMDSSHRPETRKDVKWGMSGKTGLPDEE
ncbi:MAG: hypothetical protein M1299_06625 [Firmicutes bacterium]|nr:hypothetical protein [Bacillota bacterium]MCL5039482.1 hypothetical protein [Bacillota bacterium]